MKLNTIDRSTWVYDAIKMAYEAGARCGLKNIEEECDKVYALTRYIHPPTKVLRKPPTLLEERKRLKIDDWMGRVVSWINKNKDKMSLDQMMSTLQAKYIISDEYKKLLENEYND